jgi:hypothetical protein
MRSKSSPVNGLVGLFVHRIRDGRINMQGRVIGIDEPRILVQLASWIDGSPTIVQAWTREVIYSDECRLYASEDHMKWAYEQECRAHGEHI